MVLLLIAFCGTMSLASDDFAGGCERKEQAIETKMEYARKPGNQETAPWTGRSSQSGPRQVVVSDGTLRSKAELQSVGKAR